MSLSKKLASLIFLGVFISVICTTFLIIPLLESNINIQIQSDLNVVIFTLIEILIFTIFIVLPITIVIWFLLTKEILKPIKKFSEITKVIASGNLGKKIQYLSGDELGELAQNINNMVKNLVSSYQHMANSYRNEKQNEKELEDTLKQIEKEKAKDEALLSSISEGVVAVSKDQRIILFNDAASRLTGFNQEEAINMPYSWVLKFLNEKDDTLVEDFIRSALLGLGQKSSNHIVLLRRDGKRIPVLHSAGIIKTSDNQIYGIVVVLRDITHERDLDKLKDEFVSIASHELRTPMTAIKGLISMIFEGDFGRFSQDLKDPLSDIASSTDRLIQLVNDMLDVSRIEAGRLKFTLGEYESGELIDDIVVLMKPLTDEKGLTLEVQTAVQEVVFTDPNKFKQILSNLVGNAIKFTDGGKIDITVRKEGELLYISVTDTGFGISKEDQQKLFSKFTQISFTQLGRPGGTGLGLYISREFARSLGGNLWIERSEPGVGTTFTFSVPLSGTTIAKKVEQELSKFIDSYKPV